MRVLHYLDTDTFAGTEQHVLTLLRGLTAEGVECGLLCRGGTEFAKRAMSIPNVRVFPVVGEGLMKGVEATATNRFPSLEVLETSDPTVYFDARDGFASPIQSYLEMRAGDERLRQSAGQVRERILTK